MAFLSPIVTFSGPIVTFSRLKKTKLNLGDTVGFLNMEEMHRFTKRIFIKMLRFVCAIT